jgi:ATP-dependent Lon protease
MSVQNLPVIPLRGITVFPNMVISFPVGRESSLKAIDAAQKNNENVFLVSQKDIRKNDPDVDDLYTVGTVSSIKQVLKLPGNITHVIVEGISRAKIEKLFVDDYMTVDVLVIDEKDDQDLKNDIQCQALMRCGNDMFDEYLKINKRMPETGTMLTMVSAKTPGEVADSIAAGINIDNEVKQEILEILSPVKRLEFVIQKLSSELQILRLKNEIETQVKSNLDTTQRKYYLREQLKVIQEKLGDKDGMQSLVEEFKNKAKEKKFPQYVSKTVEREIDRMSKMQLASPEANVSRLYIEHILELPWTEKTKENTDLKKAEKILENDHYGLKDIKERIIEFLAVHINSGEDHSSIICFVGPPGVGKTSIAKSIARATGREYVRMSLGGIKDEAEIRGHRRTYIGAMSGRIINAMKQAKVINPLILLDEVDKISKGYNGDPASALLEVLDREQNNNFNDHYLEIPYDLSNVLFICTANDVSAIPAPLRDRMEIINISGYTIDEKKNIAMKYLYPKQLKYSGLNKSKVKIDENVIEEIIDGYTREAGVRQLERMIEKICRRSVINILEGKKKSVKVTKSNLEDFLGTRKFTREMKNKEPLVGVVRGLAWTSVGGVTIEVEAGTMKGTGKIELTGNMGDVMKESAKAALSYIRSNSDKFAIDSDFYKNTDIHIHIPEGAVPKDGPSAGITMATAMISALTGAKVRNDVAMTGEITITGRVLHIGGLKEKVMAAKMVGIDTIIVPSENEPQVKDIPEEIKGNLEFIRASNMSDVLNTAVAEGENVWR